MILYEESKCLGRLLLTFSYKYVLECPLDTVYMLCMMHVSERETQMEAFEGKGVFISSPRYTAQ